MILTIDFKGAGYCLQEAIAEAIGAKKNEVEILVSLPHEKIPFCAEWRVVKSCADVCAKIKGEYLLLNVI